MAGDIEAFLKMAAERRKQAAQNQGGAKPAQAGAPQPRAYQPPRQVNQRPETRQNQSNQPYRPPTQPPAQQYQAPAEIVEAIPLPAASDDPYYEDDYQKQNVYKTQPRSRLVNREVSSLDISSHAEHLGDTMKKSSLVADAEKRFGGHDTTYDRKVVDYGLAGEVIRMLTEPRSVAAAVVLNEILKRPDFD